jgi:metallophosphoesterase superfamily enzyme
MDFTIENFIPEKSFSLHTADEHVGHEMPKNSLGFEMPKIDMDKIIKEIKEVENMK